MSDRRRRKLPWHQRPRAWISGWLYHVFGAGEERELTDDHGNHISGDLPPVDYGREPAAGSVWQAARLHDGTILPLDGKPSPPGYNPAWAPCQFRQDVRRPVIRSADGVGLGPGYRQNVPRPGSEGNWVNPAGPGHLTMWDQVHVRSPWTPRPDDTIIQSGPRLCAGRIALLAGV